MRPRDVKVEFESENGENKAVKDETMNEIVDFVINYQNKIKDKRNKLLKSQREIG